MPISIIPLELHSDPPMKMWTVQKGRRVEIERTGSAMIAWYIDGAEKKILVDTGPCDEARVRNLHPYTDSEKWNERTRSIEKELSEIAGVKPEEIDVVMYTHLHWDHTCGIMHFRNGQMTTPRFTNPNIEHVCQKAELLWAIDPIPTARVAYEHPSLGRGTPWLQVPIRTVDGEKEIVKGVTVFLTPGHTKGGMSVAVETSEGPYIIAGDAVSKLEEIRGTPNLEFIMTSTVMGGYLNMDDLWKSLEKIVEFANGRKDHVLAGHDMEGLKRKRWG
jgi:N-acyl homoserine lactone hydrolase